jgi:hypothetical protein
MKNWRKRKKYTELAKRKGLNHGFEYRTWLRLKVHNHEIRTRNHIIYNQAMMYLADRRNPISIKKRLKEYNFVGELEHPVDTSFSIISVDASRGTDFTCETRLGISPEGDVVVYGFDLIGGNV